MGWSQIESIPYSGVQGSGWSLTVWIGGGYRIEKAYAQPVCVEARTPDDVGLPSEMKVDQIDAQEGKTRYRLTVDPNDLRKDVRYACVLVCVGETPQPAMTIDWPGPNGDDGFIIKR